MSTRRRNRLTRRSAEQALDRRTCSGDAGLDELLSAATAPPAATELNREAEALAMFQVARLSPVSTTRRTNIVKTTMSKFGAAKVIVAGAAAAVLATGGIALAASTGHLPNPLGNSAAHQSATGAAHSAARDASASPSAEATDTPTATPTDTPTGTPTAEPTDTASAHPSANPTPSFRGLCHAYQAGATSNNGKALNNPAFTALANAAGGTANIATYCVTLLATPAQHPTHPVHPVHPTKAAHPVHPVQPTHSAHPTKPAHPVHPTASAHPTHPVHPATSRSTKAHAAS